MFVSVSASVCVCMRVWQGGGGGGIPSSMPLSYLAPSVFGDGVVGGGGGSGSSLTPQYSDPFAWVVTCVSHMCAWVYVRERMCVCISVRVYVRACTCVCACAYACAHVCKILWVSNPMKNMHICVYIHTCIYSIGRYQRPLERMPSGSPVEAARGMRHVMRMNEAYHTCEWGMLHIWMQDTILRCTTSLTFNFLGVGLFVCV